MNANHSVLIYGQGAEPCANACCHGLEVELAQRLPNVRVQTSPWFQMERRAEPALIVLRCRKAVDIERVTAELNLTPNHAPVLAVICGMEDSEILPAPTLRLVDDYLCCPFRMFEFMLRVRRLLPDAVETADSIGLQRHERLRDVIGDSRALQQVLAKIPAIADCDTTCLLEGETGTGKELFARAIHYMGPRRDKPFVPVNCGALPDHLIENELFGHVRGAYTDASTQEPGLIAYAEDGTLFLDEVDALSTAAQVKLLRLLQEQEYRQVGSGRMLRSNARVIAAANTDLRRAVESKRFREDLYHRLNVLHLTVPPLRERQEDIPTLARHFLTRFAEKYHKNTRQIAASALRKLGSYSWPGNVRELEGVIQRAVIMSDGTLIQSVDIELPQTVNDDAETLLSLRKAKEQMVQQFERSYLIEVLSACGGNVSHAARTAGKERRSFQRLIQKYDIDLQQFR